MEQKKMSLKPLLELLTEKISPHELATVLDEIMVEYSCFNLNMPGEQCRNAGCKVLWLRNLRDALFKVAA